MKVFSKKFSFKAGFSIGEVLIALFVLTFGILAAIYLMTGSMKDAMRSRDLLIASMLSQEGTELVRNLRDNNSTEKSDVNGRLDVFTGFPTDGNCTVDYNFDVNDSNNSGDFISVLKCPSSSYDLYLNNVDQNGVKTSFYTHTGGTKTKFKRKIIIKSQGDGIKDITSMVIWNSSGVFPNDINNCNIGQDCMYSTTTLTKWLDDRKD